MTNMYESNMHNVEQQKPDPKEYVLYDYVYIYFKNKRESNQQ